MSGTVRAAVARVPGARAAWGRARPRLGAARRTVLGAGTTWRSAGWRVSAGPRHADALVADRVRVLCDALARDGLLRSEDDPSLQRVAEAIGAGGDRAVWLALAVLQGELPESDAVVAVRRRATVHGIDRVLQEITAAVRRRTLLPGPRPPRVRAVHGAVLVDVDHTASTSLATGIQRVARLTTERWVRDHDVTLVGWTASGRALRALSAPEARRATHGGEAGDVAAVTEVLVPVTGTYLLPELVTEEPRLRRLAALARFSGLRTGVIGFDCVPVTSAETTAEAMGGAFAQNLATVREFTRVGAISHAAAGEYRGWRRMCRAAGMQGPEIDAVPLPVEPGEVVEGADARFAARTGLTRSMPFVLVVGSHEPRKNHLAVLHAAERLWSEGARFAVLFVGGNSWRSEGFHAELERLVERGCPVDTLRALPEDELWAAYRTARCVVFPSLNEGFGLPVAEAVAVGTPALTSAFGSMAEIAAGGGGVLMVDPRDDSSVLDGLRALVQDDDLVQELRRAALARQPRTWDTYAAELWDTLVNDSPPSTRSPGATAPTAVTRG